MAKAYVSGKGSLVKLGRELGKGGEGSVYEIEGVDSQVAKLYHRPLDSKKQAKLSYMAATVDEKLLRYAAWPIETLREKMNGPVVGFMMPKVSEREPIHMLYSPAHRRQDHPKATWELLLWVARNTAAAFETLHAHGHVLGDVNQGNVMVGADSRVILIDADSFQVNANGTLHLCEVGVSHFTPPELQGLPSFDGVKRTPNHDNFGLALIVFHLLFGGRHPYSGVPLRKGVGDALETDIKAFRYAYASDAEARGFKAPPASIPISLVPEPGRLMFEHAFVENGAVGGRPTATQWVAELDRLRQSLKRCSVSAMHVHPVHLFACPWCALEKQGVDYFPNLTATFNVGPSGFVLTKVWGLIDAAKPPGPLDVPQPASAFIKGAALPPGMPSGNSSAIQRVLVVAGAIGLIAALPQAVWLILIAAAVLFFNVGKGGGVTRQAEQRLRKAALDLAEGEYTSVVNRLRAEAGPEGFQLKKRQLGELKTEYQGLGNAERAEIELLKATAESRQRKQFLERQFIDSASILGVGPATKAALRSFGIETAADVSWSKVHAVRGFGEVKTRAVVDWRNSWERRFTFNPNAAVTQADRNAVNAKFAANRNNIEGALTAGVNDLQRFQSEAAQKRAVLLPMTQSAAEKLAQAKADFAML